MINKHIRIETPVEQDMKSVSAQFDNKLFDVLQPPFPPVKILRFDGSAVGDEVHVKLFTDGRWRYGKPALLKG